MMHKLNGAVVYLTTYDLLMHRDKIIGGTTHPLPDGGVGLRGPRSAG